MKPFVLLLSLSCLSMPILFGQESGKILDVRIAPDGKIEDDSGKKRPLEIKDTTISRDKNSATLESINAISVPYDADDTLFRSEPQTWIFRLKIPDPLTAPSVCLAGRWNAGENRRSFGLLTLANEGRLQLLVSAEGTADSSAGLANRETLPADAWIVVVAKFQPGARMEIQIFDDEGELIDERQMTANVPAAFFEDEIPFWIGAPREVALEFSRFTAWNRILSDTQLKAELKKLR
jgi:hypothetical protein